MHIALSSRCVVKMSCGCRCIVESSLHNIIDDHLRSCCCWLWCCCCCRWCCCFTFIKWCYVMFILCWINGCWLSFKNYMLIIIECEIPSLLLENVALRMGNLQVIKISCWLLLWVIISHCVLMRFYEHDVETFWWDFTLRPSCQSCLRFLN